MKWLGKLNPFRRREDDPQNSLGTARDRDGWFVEFLCGPRNESGVRVNSNTAMGVGAYFASIRNISEDIGKLPLKVYRRRADGQGKEPYTAHPVYNLLHTEPNPEMTAMAFRETLTAHALGWQGGFAEIVRRADGRPAQLWPLDPTAVTIKRRNQTMDGFDRSTSLVYEVRNGQTIVTLNPSDVLHIHGLGFDGITGFLMSKLAEGSLGRAMGAQQHATSFFGNGATPSGVVTLQGALKPEMLKQYREQFADRHQGAKNSGKPLILDGGASWTPTGSDPERSQLVETMEFSVADVARWFRMPPHKIQDLLRSTFSNIESQNIEYVVDCLTSWAVRWEQEINRKLFMPGERRWLFSEHLFAGLLRGDMKSRSEALQIQRRNGIISANDWREIENLNPLPDDDGGELYIIEANMTKLADVGSMMETPSPGGDELVDETEEPQDTARRLAMSQVRMVASCCERLYKIEQSKVERGRKRGDLDVDGFYAEHEAYVFGVFGDAVDAYLRAVESVTDYEMTGDSWAALTQQVCEAHIDESKEQANEEHGQWGNDRAERFAEATTEAFAAFIAGEAGAVVRDGPQPVELS